MTEDDGAEANGNGDANGGGGIIHTVGEDDAYDSPFGAPLAAPLIGAHTGDANGDTDQDAYDSPFGAPVAAEADGNNAPAVGASLLGGLGGALGGFGGKVGGAVSSVASKTKIGEVSGSLWERSSAMRQSLSTVTKDVASAMKEELVGVSSTVGDGVKSVQGLVATGSGSDDERTPLADDATSLEHASADTDNSPRASAWDNTSLEHVNGMQDMQEVSSSGFVDLDQDAFYSASLATPTAEASNDYIPYDYIPDFLTSIPYVLTHIPYWCRVLE